MSNWISVKIPPKDEGKYWVSIISDRGLRAYTTAYFEFLTGNSHGYKWCPNFYNHFNYKVTHWMPIESLPEDK
jgi:hypothetical protein